MVESLGGWDKLMETLRKRLEEQKDATRAAASGSVPAAPRRSAPTATTRKASGSARKGRAIGAP